MIERNDPCWCRSGVKWKKCHYPHSAPSNLSHLALHYLKTYNIILKTTEQVEGIRKACKLTARILDRLCSEAKEGITTLELDELSRTLHQEAGAIPACLGYGDPPYPKTICTSLNEVICHGIPDKRPLQNGDIVNIDVSTILDGYFGDCSRMVLIGDVTPEKQLVCKVSLECLHRSIAVCKPGVPLSAIGKAIEDYATSMGLSVVNEFVGHGVGIEFHEPPEVAHHYNSNHIPMVEGMTFTIEPMINVGVRSGVIDPRDGWTVRTKDGKPSAQWEHTLLITATGHEILTRLFPEI
jgi:methionyl aminopeptidase